MRSMVEINVVWGEETLNPKPYNILKVGPFSVTFKCEEHEIEKKMLEVYAKLDRFAQKVKKSKYEDFSVEEASHGK